MRKVTKERAEKQEERVFELSDGTQFLIDARVGLLEMSIKLGLQALSKMLEEDVASFCGARYSRDREAGCARWGTTKSEVVLGGRKQQVSRTRVRKEGQGDLTLPTLAHYGNQDPLREHVLSNILAGVSTRKYESALETDSRPDRRGTSRSAVSRRFIALTTEKMVAWLGQSLADLDLAILMVDGIHYGDHLIIVGLGIDTDGQKHVLGLAEGGTENSTVCLSLLTDLVERGISTEKQYLWVLDGSKALRKSVTAVFGKEVRVQRCQEHKIRNVLGHLGSGGNKTNIELALRQAYRSTAAAVAKRQLENLVKQLETRHPGAANSLREGLDETITVIDLQIPTALRTSLQSTNIIESCLSTVDQVTKNVKRWKSGTMVMRWVATGLLQAEKQFRRVRGYRSIPNLISALNRKPRSDEKPKAAAA